MKRMMIIALAFTFLGFVAAPAESDAGWRRAYRRIDNRIERNVRQARRDFRQDYRRYDRRYDNRRYGYSRYPAYRGRYVQPGIYTPGFSIRW